MQSGGKPLAGRRCLVTGASGHLGAYLTTRLVKAGAGVAACVRPDSDTWRLSEVLGEIQVLHADLADPAMIDGALRSAEPEIVFHLGWYGVTGSYRTDPEQITRNVSGSLALLESARSVGCSSWIGVGSQAEYGPYAGLLTEDLPARPVSAYGVSKLCVGLLSKQLCEAWGIRHVWLRLLATYGPQDDDRHLIPSVIRQLLASETPSLTAGEQAWDYLYVEDAAEAIYSTAVTDTAQGTYNLGSGEAHTVRNIVERVRDLIDPASSLGFGDIPYQPNQVMRLQADISRLRSATGWEPRMGLNEGLRRTIDWHRTRLAT